MILELFVSSGARLMDEQKKTIILRHKEYGWLNWEVTNLLFAVKLFKTKTM